MNIFVPKSERIRSDWICTPLLPMLALIIQDYGLLYTLHIAADFTQDTVTHFIWFFNSVGICWSLNLLLAFLNCKRRCLRWPRICVHSICKAIIKYRIYAGQNLLAAFGLVIALLRARKCIWNKIPLPPLINGCYFEFVCSNMPIDIFWSLR
jgi:hypothetical protein